MLFIIEIAESDLNVRNKLQRDMFYKKCSTEIPSGMEIAKKKYDKSIHLKISCYCDNNSYMLLNWIDSFHRCGFSMNEVTFKMFQLNYTRFINCVDDDYYLARRVFRYYININLHNKADYTSKLFYLMNKHNYVFEDTCELNLLQHEGFIYKSSIIYPFCKFPKRFYKKLYIIKFKLIIKDQYFLNKF